jgi:5-methylcytosine-specific restriction protein A
VKRTPLKRKAGLVAKTPMKRGKSKLGLRRRDTGPTEKVRDIVKARARGLCERCGKHRGGHIHHRDPRGMGGTSRPEANLPSNLLYLNPSCHEWTEHNRSEALDLGLLLHDGDNPRREKVFRRGEWRWLDNAGGFEPPPTCPLGCAVWTSNDPCDCNALEAS